MVARRDEWIDNAIQSGALIRSTAGKQPAKLPQPSGSSFLACPGKDNRGNDCVRFRNHSGKHSSQHSCTDSRVNYNATLFRMSAASGSMDITSEVEEDASEHGSPGVSPGVVAGEDTVRNVLLACTYSFADLWFISLSFVGVVFCGCFVLWGVSFCFVGVLCCGVSCVLCCGVSCVLWCFVLLVWFICLAGGGESQDPPGGFRRAQEPERDLRAVPTDIQETVCVR